MISSTISDCINRDIAVITPSIPVVEATKLLIEKEMLGGPVVDEAGILVGWISGQECLQVCIQVAYHNQRVATVGDIMRKDVLSIKMDQDLLALASQMLENKPKNYPVIEASGRVLGVVSRRAILKVMLKELFSGTKK